MRSRSVVGLAMAAALICSGGYEATAAARLPGGLYSSAVPQAGVPLMSRPPVIDGTLGDGEWQGAVGFTGFSLAGLPCVLPPAMQGWTWVGYDATNLYVGLRCQRPPDLRVGKRAHDAADVIEGEDHWWLAFVFGDATYTFKLNPAGVFSDQKVTESDRGKNRHTAGIAWESGAAVKASVASNVWDVELAIPFAGFGLAQAPTNGTAWRTLISYGRNHAGDLQAEWNGAANWVPGNFGFLLFSGGVPAFQVVELGDLTRLDFSPTVRVSNPTDHRRDVAFKVNAECGAQVLQSEAKALTLEPGQSALVPLGSHRLSLPEGWSGRVVIEADAGGDHLYSQMLQFQPLGVPQYRTFARFWPFDAPLKEIWDLRCANYPYFGSMDVWVDLTAPTLPAAVKQATQASVELRRADGGRIIRQATLPLAGGKARAHWADVKLAEGAYTLVGRLATADGQSVGVTVTNRFVRKVFPWEHNTVGVSDKVYSPFTPIRLNAARTAMQPWGRSYAVGVCGLPGAVTATPEAQVGEASICGPTRLEVVGEGGQRETFRGPTRIVKAADGLVRLEGQGEAAGLSVKTESFLQYDGWYQVSLTISAAQAVKVQGIELVIPFGAYPDTYYGYRSAWFYGGLAKKVGELWNNVSKRDNLFTPAIAVGNGDVALWWYADSDEGWRLSYSNASQRIVRDADGVSLRMALVNVPATLTPGAPVRATFAVLANPVRPMSTDFRAVQWGVAPRFHDTAGYAYWGNGIDSITPGSEDGYRRTREAIDKWTGRTATNAPQPFPPIILYNSGMMLGQGMEEFDTFGGEWIGQTPPDPTPEFPDSDLHAQVPWHGGLRQDWRGQPKRLGPTVADLTQSCVDCRIWHYRQNMEKLGINGYWFDNQPIWAGRNTSTDRAYTTPDGTVRPKYCVFNRHELFRRMFVMYREAGREPINFTSYSPVFSFAGGLWLTEMDAYVYGHGQDLFDTLSQVRYYDIVSQVLDVEREQLEPVARFRGMTRMRRNVPSFLRSNVTDVHASRSVLGLCLLHDVGCSGGVAAAEVTRVRGALKSFGLFDGPAEFVPYWRNADWVRTSAPEVLAALYCNPKGGAVLVALLNTGVGAAKTEVRLIAGKRPAAASQLIDAETGLPLEASLKDGQITATVDVPSHEYRLLLWP